MITPYHLFVSVSVVTIVGIFFVIVILHEIKCRKARQKIPELLTNEPIKGRDLRQKLAHNGIQLQSGRST